MIRKGETVVHGGRAFVSYPLAEAHCSECGLPFSPNSRRFSCDMPTDKQKAERDNDGGGEFHEEYCSRECRNFARITRFGAVARNRKFQALELELFARYEQTFTTSNHTFGMHNDKKCGHDNTSAGTVTPTQTGATDAACDMDEKKKAGEAEMMEERMMKKRLRIHRMNERAMLSIFLPLLRVYSIALDRKLLPTALPEIRCLSGEAVFEPETFLPEFLSFYRRLTTITNTSLSVSFEEFVCLFAKLKANAFMDSIPHPFYMNNTKMGSSTGRKSSCDEDENDDEGHNNNNTNHETLPVIRLPVHKDLLNHSCAPNCAEEATTKSSSITAAPHESTGAPHAFSLTPGGACAVTPNIIALRDIHPGEEVTICYFPSIQPLTYAQRRVELSRRDFDCKCERCIQQR